jgi:hypothetical protein
MGTATQFTDDAYNKELKGKQSGYGTLVGNWYEEGCQREGTGEGRTVPQRHVRRSGLLKDFTRLPSDGFRKSDDTFERLYGHRKYEISHTSASAIGKPDGKCHLTELQSEPMQASLRLPQVGVRQIENNQKFYKHAVESVKIEEDAKDALNEIRYFETAANGDFLMPNPNDVEKPQFPRTSMRRELLSGPALPDSEVLGRKGLDFDKQTHYSLQEAVTANTEFASNPDTIAAVKISYPDNGFRRNTTVSCPVENFVLGAEKDSCEPGLAASKPLPLSQVNVAPTLNAMPVTLVQTKAAIIKKFVDKFGPLRAIVELRNDLEAHSEADGTVTLSNGKAVLESDGIPSVALDVYLKQMATMSKKACQISKVMDSIRPPLPATRSSAVAAMFDSLSVDGFVMLGSWTASIADGGVRASVMSDLGDDPAMVIGKASFYEYLADLVSVCDDETCQGCLAALRG